MFSYESDASKAAIAALVRHLDKWHFHLLDAQVKTGHLLSLGAKEMSRKIFLQKLQVALQLPTMRGRWEADAQISF
jgi:leucyl/phenylalanyl-tRNA--protein transferase